MSRIQLRELRVHNYRNLASVALFPQERFNVISGRNGVGKTNLIESIYLLGALRSFRTSVRGELLPHNTEAQTALVQGVFSGALNGLRCEISLQRTGRSVKIDGKSLVSASDHFHMLPMVLFHPATMSLIQGGPDSRRRFMDRALFQAEPSYPSVARDYGRALMSRNTLLKHKSVDRRSIEAFDGQLARLGSAITKMRKKLIEGLADDFSRAFTEISDGLQGSILYRPRTTGNEEEILLQLKERFQVDVVRGHTSFGPHGDELDIQIQGKPARKFASQGQQRLLALALKIAETNLLTRETGTIPLLLLDDVSSELDREKNRQLFGFLRDVGGQVFITTTHLAHILLDGERKDFEVESGVVTERCVESLGA